MNIFWKMLIVANLVGLVSLAIYTTDKNNYFSDKVLGLEQVSSRLIKETQALKAVNRDLVEASEKLKFRIERLEFEGGEGYIEGVQLLPFSGVNFEGEGQELMRDVSSGTVGAYRFNVDGGYCDIARSSIITLVAAGLGELAYICDK